VTTECPECRDGRRKRDCDVCEGAGVITFTVSDHRFDLWVQGADCEDEMLDLQSDFFRVQKQAQSMRELVPARAATYTEQEVATLAEIEKQAEKLWKKRHRHE